jgi:hypothetical protein
VAVKTVKQIGKAIINFQLFNNMDNTKVYKMSFASVYPHYINKAERKGRTKEEVDEIIRWLTGYNQKTYRSKSTKRLILKLFLTRRQNSIQMLQKSQVDLWISYRRN